MNQNHNPKLRGLSRKLRKEMTPEERKLWFGFLKEFPVTVNRQKVIGPYIVDFYCASKKLVIELDGSQHFEETGQIQDVQRDNYLSEQGIAVVRYANSEIRKNFSGVCEDLKRRLQD